MVVTLFVFWLECCFVIYFVLLLRWGSPPCPGAASQAQLILLLWHWALGQLPRFCPNPFWGLHSWLRPDQEWCLRMIWAVADSDDCPWPSLPHWGYRMSWSSRKALQFLAAIATLPKHRLLWYGVFLSFCFKNQKEPKKLKILAYFCLNPNIGFKNGKFTPSKLSWILLFGIGLILSS